MAHWWPWNVFTENVIIYLKKKDHLIRMLVVLNLWFLSSQIKVIYTVSTTPQYLRRNNIKFMFVMLNFSDLLIAVIVTY